MLFKTRPSLSSHAMSSAASRSDGVARTRLPLNAALVVGTAEVNRRTAAGGGSDCTLSVAFEE
jgi:hypothetical protein